MYRFITISLIQMGVILFFAATGLCGEFETVLEKAERGDSNAMDYLGLMYLKGQGIERDYKKAIDT